MGLFNARTGDANIELTVDLADETGPVDLATATTITFKARRHGDTDWDTPTITGTADQDDDTPGRVTYTLTHDDLADDDLEGDHDVIWIVAWADNSRDTFPRPGTDTLRIGL